MNSFQYFNNKMNYFRKIFRENYKNKNFISLKIKYQF